jgi:hypothetical protein
MALCCAEPDMCHMMPAYAACADSGVRSFANKVTCCGPNGAFGQEGCSNTTIPVPCWVVDSYYPDRSCRRSSDVAVCNRGEGGAAAV